MKMQAKSLAVQAKKTEKEAELYKKKMYAELQKGNEDGARIYSEMIIQRKNHYRNLILMSVKIEIAANDIKLQMQTGDAIKQIANASACMKAYANELDSLEVFKIFGEFNSAMNESYIQQSVINKVMCPLQGEEQETMVNELLEQAKMEFANNNISPEVPLNTVASTVDVNIEKRLSELLPSL